MMEELVQLVHRETPDLYLSALLAPEKKRQHLMALYAFSAEISRIPAQVSEAPMAEIRLQWWLDALDALYANEPQDHPVAKALSHAIKEGDLPKYALVRLVKAHQQDFYSDPPPTLNDLEGYLGDTWASLIKLAAMILDQDDALQCAEACGFSGVAYGLTQVLNGLPKARALKQCLIPSNLLKQHGTSEQGVFAGNPDDAALLVCLAELRNLAQKRLQELERVSWTVENSVVPAFYHLRLASSYLKKARSRGSKVITMGCEPLQIKKQWLLWQASRGAWI